MVAKRLENPVTEDSPASPLKVAALVWLAVAPFSEVCQAVDKDCSSQTGFCVQALLQS